MVQIHGIRRASADAKYRQMTGQPVKPLILKLCLPAVISNLVTTAYNLTNSANRTMSAPPDYWPWASRVRCSLVW